MELLKKRSVFLVLFLLCSAFLPAQEVDYFLHLSGNRSFGLAFDQKGNLYMVTAPATGNGTLSRVTPDGKITEIAVLEGTFIGPGIYYHKNNSLLITVGDKLLEVSVEGKIRVIADGFARCMDAKPDQKGNIYVADDLQQTIFKITPSGLKEVFYKSAVSGSFLLTTLAFDKKFEFLYVKEGNKILRFSVNQAGASGKPEILIENVNAFYLSTVGDYLYATTIENVIRIDRNGETQKLFKEPLNTAIGVFAGGKGFDERFLYITVKDGIIKTPVLY
jgi:glucose/arabinose dehydrogenase